MFKPGRKLFKNWTLLACCFLLAGGAAFSLRPVAAKGSANAAWSQYPPITQTAPHLEFKAAPEAGPVTFHGAGRGASHLYFQDGRDFPEANVEGFSATSGSHAQPLAMTMADFNGDGIPDIVTSYGNSGGQGYVTFRAHNLHGEFAEPQTAMLPHGLPAVIRAEDFNFDGQADLAVLNADTDTVSLVFGDGRGSLGSSLDLNVGAAPRALAAVDLNHNGLTDLIVGSANHEFRIISREDTSQSFTNAVQKVFKTQAGVVSIEAADLNHDNHLDLAVATTSGVELWYGNGKGEFVRKDTLPANGLVALTLSDLNLDLFPEIAAVSSTGVVTVWTNRKGNGFSAGQTFKAAGSAVGIKAEWMDVDAYRDIVVIDKSNSQISVLLNQKGNGFQSPIALTVDSNPVDMVVGKFDLDAVNDVVVAKQSGGSQVAALTFVPNQSSQIIVTDLSNLRQIPANGTTADIQLLVTADRRVTFLDAITAANNTPGAQTIQFRVGELSATNTLNGQNFREPPILGQSIVFPNTIIAGTTGERLYNVNLVGAVGITGLTSLPLTSPNGDGTSIVGENLSGLTQSPTPGAQETAESNINKTGPDIRITGDVIFNNGFEVAAANCRFESLIISGFTRPGSQNGPGASAIEFSGVQSSAGIVVDCYLGSLDLFGSANFFNGFGSFTNTPLAALNGNRRGVRVNGSANVQVMTSSTTGARTIISGNQDHGILIEGGSATNRFTNLFVGVLKNGSTPFGNGFNPVPSLGAAGIELRNNATGNTVSGCVIDCSGINGNTAGATPLINGVLLDGFGQNAGPANNRFENNIIGLQADAVNPPVFSASITPARNTGSGMVISHASTFNTVINNTISGNQNHGVFITDLGTNTNTVTNNRIGTDGTGRLSNGGIPGSNSRGNQVNGLVVTDQASLNVVDGNTVSNNARDGIQVAESYTNPTPFPANPGTDGNRILNNKVGTDSGATPTALGANLANGNNGISVGVVPNGGGQDGNAQLNFFSKNLVFFNVVDGFFFDGDNCDLNTLTQNSIVANGQRGIRINLAGTDPSPPPVNPPGPIREGPKSISGQFSFSQEKMTTTVDDAGTQILPEVPAAPGAPANQPTAAIVVDSALLNGSLLQVTGRLGRLYASVANTYTIEVYASNTSSFPGSSTHAAGVAQRFLGTTTVAATTTPSTWSINTTGAQIGDIITATLRSPGGSTSEISVGKLVDQGPVNGTPGFSLNLVNTTPQLFLTPITVLDFGSIPINTTSTATVRLLSTGTGGAPITLNGPPVLTNAGGTPAQFTLTPPVGVTYPLTLVPSTTPTGSPGSFVDFTVSTTPTTIGAKNGEVQLSITTTANTNVSLPLRVNGTGQQISVNPTGGSTIDFGSVQVGQQSNIQNVVITNTGSAPLSVTLTLSGNDFIFDPGFALSGPPIAPNGALTVPLRFRPLNTGTRTGTLSIAHDAPNTASPIVINLRGTGLAPPSATLGSITLNGVPVGNSIDFGSVLVGSSKSLQLVLSNTGNANLVFNTTVTGDAFSGSTGNTTISPGGTAVVTLTFTPPTTGGFTGSVLFASNASNAATVGISLTGTGIAPSISLNPTSISFGTVPVNQTQTQSISIVNTGNAPLTVNSISLNGQGFQVQGAPGTPFQVQPGATQSFQVAFTPNSSSSFSGTLSVSSNARNASVVTASLSGTGGDSTPPSVTITDPRSGQAFAAGSRTTVRFSASDNTGVTSIDVLFSDGGSFSNAVTGLPGTATSFDINFSPLLNTTNARVRVVARDAAGNTGSAESGSFTVAPAPVVIDPKFSAGSGKIKLIGTGSNIAIGGAVLLINNIEVPLVFKSRSGKFITATPVSGLVPAGVTVQLAVRNPNGVVGSSVPFTRR